MEISRRHGFKDVCHACHRLQPSRRHYFTFRDKGNRTCLNEEKYTLSHSSAKEAQGCIFEYDGKHCSPVEKSCSPQRRNLAVEPKEELNEWESTYPTRSAEIGASERRASIVGEPLPWRHLVFILATRAASPWKHLMATHSRSISSLSSFRSIPSQHTLSTEPNDNRKQKNKSKADLKQTAHIIGISCYADI
ncbi:hypothetical protein CDAR_520161 [Caerostris darwini]|uniref:Uncharacterized protein n=1 Tax=Caerostris darwini TaxID=1538125 RepID=A0AAV4TV11_9ARAC|nr:hypothetical protein CDAR_520161 [Caerostris darwini]